MWGIGAGIRSKSAKENTATGENILVGNLIVNSADCLYLLALIMNNVPIYNVLIVGDSRLRYLGRTLNNTSLNIKFTVRSLPGARMLNIAQYTVTDLSQRNDFHLAIIMGGINDMSNLVYYPTKHALPRFGNTNEIIDHTI